MARSPKPQPKPLSPDEVKNELVRIAEIDPLKRPPVIVSNTTAALLIPEVVAHMVKRQEKSPTLFQQHGGVLVRIRDRGRGPIEHLNYTKFETEIDRAVQFLVPVFGGLVRTPVPSTVTTGILGGDRYDDVPEFPELRRVVKTPIFNKDGNLITEWGYHAGSRTFLQLPENLQEMEPLPDKPSSADLAWAKAQLLDELFYDFKFAVPSSRAHALAMLITPFVRELLGPVPMPFVALTAPKPGSGKSLLASTISLVVTGQHIKAMAADLPEQEKEKRITALLLSGTPFALFDNAIERVDSPAMAALLTAPYWSGRTLGKTEMVELATYNTLWLITGNFLRLSRELDRRALIIRLDTGVEHPERRSGFKHAPLDQWVLQNRRTLIRAVLMLVQHWKAEGCPKFTARPFGSFEQYAQIVGGILQAAALDTGFATYTETNDDDDSPFIAASSPRRREDGDDRITRIVIEWEKGLGYKTVTTKDLIEYVPAGMFEGNERSRRTQLGQLVEDSIKRVFAGHRIIPVAGVKDEDGRTRKAWRLECVEKVQ